MVCFTKKYPCGIGRFKDITEGFSSNSRFAFSAASGLGKGQTELGLNSARQYEEVIRAFIGSTNLEFKREPWQIGGHLENELVDLAERFALLTKSSLTNAKLQRSFANFQALILLSYCEVLRKRGIPYEDVDRIIQHITNAREWDRRRLLDSALWINKIIVELVGHGWTIYRATELFFIGIYFLTPYLRS